MIFVNNHDGLGCRGVNEKKALIWWEVSFHISVKLKTEKCFGVVSNNNTSH